MEKQWYFPQNKMNLFVLLGHGSESFAAFLNGVVLQKNNVAVITAAVTAAQILKHSRDVLWWQLQWSLLRFFNLNITPFENTAKDSLPCHNNTNKFILFWGKYYI